MGLCLVICVFIKDRGLSRKEPEPAAKDSETAPPQPQAQVQDSGKDTSPSDTGSAGTDIETGGDSLTSRKS